MTGAGFFSISLMIFWPVAVYFIVVEKAQRLRFSLHMMGGKSASYWCSWITVTMLNLIISIILMVLTGLATKFILFYNANFFILFILLVSYGWCLICFGFLVTTFVSSVRMASKFFPLPLKVISYYFLNFKCYFHFRKYNFI